MHFRGRGGSRREGKYFEGVEKYVLSCLLVGRACFIALVFLGKKFVFFVPEGEVVVCRVREKRSGGTCTVVSLSGNRGKCIVCRAIERRRLHILSFSGVYGKVPRHPKGQGRKGTICMP